MEATVRTGRVSARAGLFMRAALAAALGWALPAWSPAPAAAAGPVDSLAVTLTVRDAWPPSPVTDLTGLPGAEGQMLLEWTAPEANNYSLTGAWTPAAGYQIRIATFSLFSMGNSTAAWWAEATDVRSLPAPAVSATPPTPGTPGTTDSLLLSNLEPGVTYWAMIISSDANGNYSDGDTLASAGDPAYELVYDAAPPTPLNLTVTQTGISTFTVRFGSVSAYDLDFYRIYIDSTAPFDFVDGWTVTRDSSPATATVSVLITGLQIGSYTVRVAAVDKGVPGYGGQPLESAYTASVAAELVQLLFPAQAPYGIALTTAGFTSTLRWMPVVRYASGVPFEDPSAPTADELTGYRVYRATAPTRGVWTIPDPSAIIVGTTTLSWTDLAGGPQYYYHVKAQNASSLSRMSVVRAAGSKSAWVVAPDDQSSIEVFSNSVQPVEGQHVAGAGVASDPMSAYLVEATSRPHDVGGRILRSIDFGAWKGGLTPEPHFAVNQMGIVRMHYDLGASGSVTAAGYEPMAGVTNSPENMSVYWFNGSKWVQLYGELDTHAQVMSVESKFFGQYQLRTVERPQAFNFNQAGISNRMVTPNGDGKNDSVVFRFDNPRDSEVSIRILDLRGKQVATVTTPGDTAFSRMWTPGPALPGGVYIYQIESEGQVFSGTIVLIK